MSISVFGEDNAKLKSLPRREREDLRQRREILDAAQRLFSAKGYHYVSMREIAGEAEYGIGTLYKFFDKKEHLYKALIMEVAKSGHCVLLQVLEQEGNPLHTITKYIAQRQELFSDNLPLMRLYFAETRGVSFNIKAGLDQDLRRLYDEVIEKLASVFERGIKENVFRNLDPYYMALALEGTISAFVLQIMTEPARFREGDDLSTAADIFLKGVLSK